MIKIPTIVFCLAILSLAPVAAQPGPGPFRALDSDASGTLDLEEFLAGGEQRFQRQDENADGFLSQEEFAQRPRLEPGQRAQGFLRRSDGDGDGIVSQAEFDTRLQERFDRLDTDGDGALSPDEMKVRGARGFRRMDTDGDGSVSQADLDALIQRRQDAATIAFTGMDTNGDNRIELAEMLAQAEARFDELDKNDDGILTIQEMRRGRTRGRRE